MNTPNNIAGEELYDEALAVVRAEKKASISLLQRRLKIGYLRAQNLIELLAKKGVIGPEKGAKPREVYETNVAGEEWNYKHLEIIDAAAVRLMNDELSSGEFAEIIAQELEAVHQEATAGERLRCFEILHKFAMQTTDTFFLDLIEAAQKEILASLTPTPNTSTK